MSRSIYRLLPSINEWVRLNLLLLACMVVVRPLFFLEVHYRIGVEPTGLPIILSGAYFDLLLVSRIFTFGLVPFLLLHYFFPKIAKSVYLGLIILYALVSAILAEYYCNLGMPLDHVILVYTNEELKTTLFSSTTSISYVQVFWFVLQVGLPVLLCWLWQKVQLDQWLSVGVSALWVSVAFLVNYPAIIREERMFQNHYDFCMAINQPSYSYVKITDFIKELRNSDDPDPAELRKAVKVFHASHPEFEYDTPGFPFYRKVTEKDVLGTFFNPTSDNLPPNLVFIIIEGYGRRLTGVWEPKVSFTPYLDSIASEGLFWPNCLSTSERTFGVLPSVFASAPHGRFGFSTPLAPTSRHQSLIKDLKRNGYTSSFYYGGDLAFDRYDYFLNANQVDYLFAPKIVVNDSAFYQLLVDNNRWGLDDNELVKCAIKDMERKPTERRPHLDIYLTLSTHEPFVIDNLEYYEKRVQAIVDNTPDISNREHGNVMKNMNVFACFLYMDQSIRKLMSYYATRPDYANTIFVITGDHRMAQVPFGTAIRRYNVPLIIYSPLLKRSKTMNAVVSHLDIPPTFNAYLNAQYDYAISDHCHWLGTSIDTVSQFRNTNKLAFMLNNRDVIDYYSGDYMISKNDFIKIGKDFMESKGDREEVFDSLKRELKCFDMVSRFVVKNDILLPMLEDRK